MNAIKPVAIVTGASTGIGKHISIKLSKNNYHVILISRNEQKLQLVEKYIKDKGNDCSIVCADVGEKSSIEKISSIPNIHNIDVLANTSFNISSDPMVYSLEDALLALERMNIKYLMTEHGIYKKK